MIYVLPNLIDAKALDRIRTSLRGADFVDGRQTSGRAVCRSCGRDSPIDAACFLCPDCASPDLDVVSGEELTIASVEVD